MVLGNAPSSMGEAQVSVSFQKLGPALVCGDRRGQGLLITCNALDIAQRTPEIPAFGAIVTGGHTGTDGEAFMWAMKKEMPALVVPAKWKTGEAGGGEGPIRNRKMIRLAWPAFVLALPGRDGTEDMVKVARQASLPVWRWIPFDERWELRNHE